MDILARIFRQPIVFPYQPHPLPYRRYLNCPRLVQALSDIGVAVIHGGVSTFLAVVLLSASASYVFRVRAAIL